MEKGEGLVVQEVNVFDILEKIGTKSKVSQAKILQRLETVIDDPKEYAEIRKFILDELNGLTRAYVKATFGNIEYLVK